jgi:hypothetical protein
VSAASKVVTWAGLRADQKVTKTVELKDAVKVVSMAALMDCRVVVRSGGYLAGALATLKADWKVCL